MIYLFFFHFHLVKQYRNSGFFFCSFPSLERFLLSNQSANLIYFCLILFLSQYVSLFVLLLTKVFWAVFSVSVFSLSNIERTLSPYYHCKNNTLISSLPHQKILNGCECLGALFSLSFSAVCNPYS